MAASTHLKDLKAVWRDACHTMWAELLSVRCTVAYIHEHYSEFTPSVALSSRVYAPESRGRLDDVTPDVFLERAPLYQTSIVTSRVVLLSAAFELYFGYFLDTYLEARPKYWDAGTVGFTTEGNRVLGEVRKLRGIVQRIEKFGELTTAKLNASKLFLPALKDVTVLRNVIAHRAGHVDDLASGSVSTITLTANTRVALSPNELINLADPIIKLADELDRKIARD